MTASPEKYSKLFSDGAAAYALYRPTYPRALYERIYAWGGLKRGAGSVVVDVATGQGQAALQMTGDFERVLAVDANPDQINFVRDAPPNVEFKVADAHNLGLPNSSVDLVAVAQGLHWFDIPRFYKEAARVLKHDGCLAAWSYDIPTLNGDDSKATDVLRKFYSSLSEYWADRRYLVEQRYKGLEPDMETFKTSDRQSVPYPTSLTIPQVVGWFSSWSAYRSYLKKNPQGEGILETVQNDLMQAIDSSDTNTPVDVVWPITVLLAKDPVKE